MVLWLDDSGKVTPLQSDPSARVWAVVGAATVAFFAARFFRRAALWAEDKKWSRS